MKTSVALILGVIVIVLLYLISKIASHFEAKAFNNGWCKECGSRLRHFDNDSHGGRGYTCDHCGYGTWVSYNRVDKNFEP